MLIVNDMLVDHNSHLKFFPGDIINIYLCIMEFTSINCLGKEKKYLKEKGQLNRKIFLIV